MALVELAIGGHRYQLSCADGEEEALLALGRTVDEQVQAARSMGGGLTETRQLLYAALFLADKLASRPGDATATNDGRTDDARPALDDDAVAAQIDRMTSRIAALTERIAQR